LWNNNETESTIDVLINENSSFSVIATNGNLCSDTAEFEVTAILIPEKPNVYNQGMVLQTDAIAEEYLWFFNNEEIDNSNSQTYLATDFGEYLVKVWNENGCSNISDIFNLTTNEVNEIPGVSSIEIYPNPTNGLLSIDFDLTEEKDIEIQIYDITGKVILQEKYNNIINKSVKILDISDNSVGIFFISIMIDDYIVIRKIVLK
jgi:hypothetical protein